MSKIARERMLAKPVLDRVSSWDEALQPPFLDEVALCGGDPAPMLAEPALQCITFSYIEGQRSRFAGTYPYSIRLDDDLRRLLEKEAEIEDRPPAQLEVRAIRSMLETKVARREAIKAALAEADRGAFVGSDAVDTWMDTWDSDEHDRIVDGMETGHPERASAAMQAHLRTIEAAMLGRAGPD